MKKVPAYQKIYLDLKNQIFQGVYPYNSRIPTEKELADYYQVSRITSKRAVDELANEHWVRRYPGKGSFVTYRSREKQSLQIGVVLNFSTNHGLKEYLAGIQKGLTDSSYSIKAYYANQTGFSFETLLSAAERNELAGLILQAPVPTAFLSRLVQLFYKGFPVILLNQEMDGLPFSAVISQDFLGGYQATRHAIEKGHEKIYFVAQTPIYSDAVVRQRYLGYLKAVTEENLSLPKLPYVPSFDRPTIDTPFMQDCLRQWEKHDLSCLVFENDVLAIEFLSAANTLGWDLPRDLSFIGFDDIPLAQLIEPHLTTIRQNFYELGVQAALCLLEQLIPFKVTPEETTQKRIEIPVALVERSSVAAR